MVDRVFMHINMTILIQVFEILILLDL